MRKLIGRPRIPPRQMYVQLPDRLTGVLWTLTHDEADERVGITDDPIPARFAGQVVKFDAFQGPTFTAANGSRCQLLIEDGRLGVEDLGEAERTVTPGLLTSRIGLARFTCVMYIPDDFVFGGVLGWRTMEF